MSVWIRSQDQTQLKKSYALNVAPSITTADYTVYSSKVELGRYGTKEEAIKIVSAIQTFVDVVRTTRKDDLITSVFQMPNSLDTLEENYVTSTTEKPVSCNNLDRLLRGEDCFKTVLRCIKAKGCTVCGKTIPRFGFYTTTVIYSKCDKRTSRICVCSDCAPVDTASVRNISSITLSPLDKFNKSTGKRVSTSVTEYNCAHCGDIIPKNTLHNYINVGERPEPNKIVYWNMRFCNTCAPVKPEEEKGD